MIKLGLCLDDDYKLIDKFDIIEYLKTIPIVEYNEFL
tara:strand:- start:228 stop:338 length:111 start_codon:yes stop_codon:yes gene_type:complete